jgi:starch-binding outer membrane protein, SusD/RagB family
LFRADNNTSPEIIFAIPFDGTNTQTWGGLTFMTHAFCGGSYNNNNIGINGCWAGVRLKAEGYGFFNTTADHPAGDNRNSFFYSTGQTVANTDVFTFTNGIMAPKYSNRYTNGTAGSNGNFPDTDYPMFRLGDAYLMYAEACVRSGGGACATTALGYVNALRARAYGGAAGNITAPQLTLPFILAERGRELLFEGVRRTDLIRYGLFAGPSVAYNWSWKGNVLAGQAVPAYYNLYPLPSTELAANPNLVQNPGY